MRYTFGLRGDALISGLISSGSEYTTASDIERELALVYDASGDIDGDGNVDALTDGLLLLRYLFGLSGDTLTVGVVASNATRTTASELEGFIIEKFAFTQGNNGSKVDHYKVNGGDHDWLAINFSDQNTEQLIWNFVSSFDINGAR